MSNELHLKSHKIQEARVKKGPQETTLEATIYNLKFQDKFLEVFRPVEV